MSSVYLICIHVITLWPSSVGRQPRKAGLYRDDANPVYPACVATPLGASALPAPRHPRGKRRRGYLHSLCGNCRLPAVAMARIIRCRTCACLIFFCSTAPIDAPAPPPPAPTDMMQPLMVGAVAIDGSLQLLHGLWRAPAAPQRRCDPVWTAWHVLSLVPSARSTGGKGGLSCSKTVPFAACTTPNQRDDATLSNPPMHAISLGAAHLGRRTCPCASSCRPSPSLQTAPRVRIPREQQVSIHRVGNKCLACLCRRRDRPQAACRETKGVI